MIFQGGDSDDDAESVGSGFTSIAPEKPESSTTPPTSNITPKEKVPSVVGTDEPKISDNVEKRVDNTTFDTASKVDDTQVCLVRMFRIRVIYKFEVLLKGGQNIFDILMK